MCNYKGLRVSRQQLLELLEIDRALTEEQHRNVVHSGFEYRAVDVIIAKDNCEWDLVEMEWGFIPPYWWTRADVEKYRKGYTDEKTGKYVPQMTTLNAKGEELLLIDPKTNRAKMYRDAALKRRCLFPATDFYEWRHIFPIGKKGQPLKTAVKYPYRIGVAGEEVFFIAGVWQDWTDRDTGETVNTCALATTNANSLMRQIHNSKNRMPTILTKELAAEWLSKDLSEKRITEIATYQIPSERLEAHTIPKDFISALNPNDKFVYQDLPELVS